MAIKYLKPNTLKNKTVLLRADVNVPIDPDSGKVGDAFRIEQILPTIRLLKQGGNRIIICGHLGRPDGKNNQQFSLKPVAEKLSELLGYKFAATDYKLPRYEIPHLVFYSGSILEDRHRTRLKEANSKDIVMLENLRFYRGEEEDSAMFAKRLAGLADAYINDAFGVDHRKAASISAITRYLPSYCGPLLEKEIKSLDAAINKHSKPLVVMMGGIKISDKVQAIEHMGKKAEQVLLAGGLANLFFMSKGYEIGGSKVEKDAVKTAWQLEKNFKDKLVLPVDLVVAQCQEPGAGSGALVCPDGRQISKGSIRVAKPFEVQKNETIFDIGPKTILTYAKILKSAKTIVWNGPLGLFEVKPFHTATFALSRVIGGVATRKAFAVVGGGETVDAVRQTHQLQHIDHVSTGGGAMLEFLAGKKLPGIEALKN